MRRRQRTANINADRDKRLRAARKKLLAAVGLKPPLSVADELRIETACWTQMAIDNQRNAIASGKLIDVADLERATTALNALLPKAHNLNVHFIDGSTYALGAARHCRRRKNARQPSRTLRRSKPHPHRP